MKAPSLSTRVFTGVRGRLAVVVIVFLDDGFLGMMMLTPVMVMLAILEDVASRCAARL